MTIEEDDSTEFLKISWYGYLWNQTEALNIWNTYFLSRSIFWSLFEALNFRHNKFTLVTNSWYVWLLIHRIWALEWWTTYRPRSELCPKVMFESSTRWHSRRGLSRAQVVSVWRREPRVQVYSTVYSVQCTEPVLCPAEAVCRRRREPGTWPWSNRWPGPRTQGLRGLGGQGVVWSYLLGIICIWIICNASLKSTFTFTHRSEQHTQWTWHEKI